VLLDANFPARQDKTRKARRDVLHFLQSATLFQELKFSPNQKHRYWSCLQISECWTSPVPSLLLLIFETWELDTTGGKSRRVSKGGADFKEEARLEQGAGWVVSSGCLEQIANAGCGVAAVEAVLERSRES